MDALRTADVLVIGAGAAGLMTAVSCARRARQLRVVCVDGARTIGAKILVSGGGRCNVTNRTVSERDFWGGEPRFVRSVLRAFPADRAAAFFEAIGVPLHEEEDGKLFPDTNRARTVLDALLNECGRLGVAVRSAQRVSALECTAGGRFRARAGAETWNARAVVLAAGGRALPKSGSDGFGYELAAALGHGHVETTPALVPLMLGDRDLRGLSGVTHRAAVTMRAEGRRALRLEGSLLWTHFGASGPVVLNASRHWHRAALERRRVVVSVSFLPEHTFETLDAWWLEVTRSRPRVTAAGALATLLPAAAAGVVLSRAGVDPATTMAHLSKVDRRLVIRGLLDTALDVTGSRGFTFAEATAGGVPLEEVDAATMESRVCPGLYVVGEILDVDGRIGGFNFQWAWSSGWAAGLAIARALDR
jgi:hypothetical protein